jgi:hypothetical protein
MRAFVTVLVCCLILPVIAAQAQAQWTWTTLDYPGAQETYLYGISGSNIVGDYGDDNGAHGFLFDGTGWTRLICPGAAYTYASGISGNNIVGVAGGLGG